MRALPQGRQGAGGGGRRCQPHEADPELDTLLDRAVKLGVFGTKMRSTINLASESGIAAIAKQQFEVGARIAKHGLVPILEPEVLIKSPDKPKAEALLKDALSRHLDALPSISR